MRGALRPERPPNPLTRLLDRLGASLLVVGAGAVLGLEYIAPNKRVIAVLAAIVMFGVTWRLNMVSGLGVLILALPFPRGMVFGSTNLAFILLLLVTWLLRVSLGQSAPPRRSPLDAPMVTLFVCYVVSFYNVQGLENVRINLECFQMMVVSWFMFYLIASSPQTRRDFGRLLSFQAVSVLLVCLVGLFEVTHPGQPLVGNWISLKREEESLLSIRAGSVFQDFELLCEFCAVNALLVLFLYLRAKSLLPRMAYGSLLVLVVFVLFTTVTRGGIIALGVGILYLFWLVRRRLTLVGVTIMAGAVAATAIGMNWFVATFTPTGDLFKRLAGSTVTGLVPDNRAEVWPGAWKRIFEHPLIGHGPWYSSLTGTHHYWLPHSLYLYVANNVGFIGLGVFLWLLWTLLRITRPLTDDLRHPDLLQGYMIIARVQLVVFLVDETKIEYLRNEIYEFQVWLMFAMMFAAYQSIHATPAGGPTAQVRGHALRGQRPLRGNVIP
jgi:O-antigen ligase